MSNKTINTNQLTPNKIILVRGKLDFCHITSLIQGDELVKLNQRNAAKGWQSEDKPHTKAALRNAAVIMQNPQAPTLEEQYAYESLYTSAQNPEKGNCFTGKNKGNVLPWVGIIRAGTTNVVDQIIPEGELAAGLDVTFVMRVFKPKNSINNGVSLDGIIVNEPIRYYQNNSIAKGLSELGITFNPTDVPAPAPAGPEPMPAVEPTTPAMPFAPANPYGAVPFTAPQPQAAPAQTGYAVPQTVQPTADNNGIHYNPAERNY